MHEENIQKLEKKMDTLIKLYAYQMVQDMTITEGAPILKRIGLTNAQIAEVFGTTLSTVSVQISKAKKK